MASLRKFILEGKAVIVTGKLNGEEKPSYSVKLKRIGALTSEELFEFAKALSHDAESWEGILHRFPEDQFTYGVLQEFEETWGGKADGVRVQAVPEE